MRPTMMTWMEPLSFCLHQKFIKRVAAFGAMQPGSIAFLLSWFQHTRNMGPKCQVPARVPPNTSVGHQGPPFSQGSKRIRNHINPSEVIKGTPEDS
ncbi:hypothetical protein V6N13_055595 [Hibiscus sabdariffa]|uniref:Uncharacterized protein n=1 Tax=Hibiscus sabdariffa TaxID=183260 RepID=A0ABR2NU82_9ROSI